VRLVSLIIVCFLVMSIFPGALKAQELQKEESFKNAINFCPGGIIFGVYSINYTRLLSPKQSLETRFDYESISEKYSGDKFDISGLGFILNYRRHFSTSFESFYIGSFVRYRNYDGTGEAGEDDFDIDISEFTIGLNVGKRWVWNSGFNLNMMFGYGYAWTDEEVTPDTPASNSSYDNFVENYEFEGPMLGEISIGYAF